MIALKRSVFWLFLLTLAACVTVNIYFPAAAAEKAADQIIQEVWQQESVPPKKQLKMPKKAQSQALLGTSLVKLAQIVSTPAYAQSPDFNATSPEVERLMVSMARRFSQLHPYFAQGIVGLTNDGFIAVRDAASANRAVQRLIDSENADRQQLYQAIADANDQPDWAEEIQDTFAQRWISQAPAGWWYQSSDGSWQQK